MPLFECLLLLWKFRLLRQPRLPLMRLLPGVLLGQLLRLLLMLGQLLGVLRLLNLLMRLLLRLRRRLLLRLPQRLLGLMLQVLLWLLQLLMLRLLLRISEVRTLRHLSPMQQSTLLPGALRSQEFFVQDLQFLYLSWQRARSQVLGPLLRAPDELGGGAAEGGQLLYRQGPLRGHILLVQLRVPLLPLQVLLLPEHLQLLLPAMLPGPNRSLRGLSRWRRRSGGVLVVPPSSRLCT